MNATIKATVTAAKRFRMEGMAMSQLYVLGDKVEEQDRVGKPVMKMNGDFEILDTIRDSVPGNFELEVELRSGGGDKMTQYVVGAKPLGNTSTAQKS